MPLEHTEREELKGMQEDLAQTSSRLIDMAEAEEDSTGGSALSRYLRDAADQLDAAYDELRYAIKFN